MTGPVVRVGSGALRGRDVGGVSAFLGVPYAAAPYGLRRFRPPEPVEPWDGIREAQAFGPTPPKGRLSEHLERMFPERWIDGEDCLNLNIWTPDSGASGLPVLIWIHGGGFTNGSSSAGELDGRAFARSGVVCVTISYRVAADGFLYLGDGIANAGLQDQIAALEWARDNIAAFGGDPARVTLAGHSAGGSSVACLLAAERAVGLFARAIIQSTSGIHRLTSPDMALRVGRDLAHRLDVPATREALAQVPVVALLAAAAAQMADLEDPDPDVWGPAARTMAPWAPSADGDVLPEVPLDAIAAGRNSDVPLLTGTTRDELRLYLTPEHLEACDEDALLSGIAKFGLDGDGLKPYRSNRPQASPGELLAAVSTDWYYRRPIVGFAETRCRAGATDTWVYRFDRPRLQENGYGAAHGVEVPFVFGTTDVGETHARIGPHPSTEVADLLHRTWVRFIETGEPGWARYDLPHRMTGVLTETLDEVPDPDGVERASWEEFV